MNAGKDVRTAFLAQEHPKYIAIKSVDNTEFSKDKPIDQRRTTNFKEAKARQPEQAVGSRSRSGFRLPYDNRGRYKAC